jgi:hypothetical protein
MEQPYQPDVTISGTPLPERTPGATLNDAFTEELRAGLLDLAAIGEQTLAEYAAPVGPLAAEPGTRHPLSDTAGISALRRRVVRL